MKLNLFAGFPSDEEIDRRFNKRFPPVSTDSAKHIVTTAPAANWEPAEQPKRLAELRLAVSLLESASKSKLEYYRSAVDLQVTKAAALRTYCALLATIAGLLIQQVGTDYKFEVLGCLFVTITLALFGALVTISTSWTTWPPSDGFSDDTGECGWLLKLLGGRGWRVNIAVIATFVATILLTIALWLVVLDRYRHPA